MKLTLITLMTLPLIAGCAMDGETVATADTAGPIAVADLRTATGGDAGRVTATAAATGIEVRVDARGLTPGQHGIHVHTVGRCDAPDFTTAGGHWNPTARQHGSMNPAGPHSGDLPNLTVDAAGNGRVEFTLAGGTMDGLLDADGGAFVVHAGPDDLKTDPSGNSGGRVACGVFAAS
ncbi:MULTISPECIES: superoxide dismutase family protein [unclassified Sphingomonas]|uniref:superoxide dismutase family protein n=1 Tax=unclassified Sphingomonas TaxID=196159 RepID=UPI0009E8283B|nr:MULTISPECIES: superoxide dismutase family protein [unclassified Sphingomonas]MCH4892608.1 superoxide dismutase family protein [Sphingomonas sp. SFZ2018-12]